jgi:hypothetical protein
MWSYKVKLDEEKLKHAKVDKRHNKVDHLPEKSVINMIGPCGLLVIVSSHLCAVPILVLWALGGVQNK